MYQRTRIVLGDFPRGKVLVRIPKELSLSYCANICLIQLTRLVPLKLWPKIEGFWGGCSGEDFIIVDVRL